MNSDLIQAAREVRERAYAPYSGYRVGAAVRSTDGRVFVGVNVENVSFGATMCAERSAIFAMVTAGDQEIAEIVVATADGGAPCGQCLQVISEFAAPETPITLVDEQGQVAELTLGELLPRGFRSSKVHRTDPPL